MGTLGPVSHSVLSPSAVRVLEYAADISDVLLGHFPVEHIHEVFVGLGKMFEHEIVYNG